MSEAATKLHRSVDLLNFFEDGTFLYLHAFCYPSSLTHCVFGYLAEPSGSYRPLTSTSFNMAEVGEVGRAGEEREVGEVVPLPSHILFSCDAVGRKGIQVSVHLKDSSAVHFTGDPWTLQHHVCFSDCFTQTRRGAGIAVFTRSYSGLCPVPERQILHVGDEPFIDMSDPTLPLVAPLSHTLSRSPCLTGGKGASLAFLTQLLEDEAPEKFDVPPGVVVTTVAWQQQLQSSATLTAAIASVEKAMSSATDLQIKDACDKAAELFQRVGACEAVEAALRAALNELYDGAVPPGARFAVRSSGSEEDGAEASAAGQNATVLGCAGVDGAIAALPTCWASLLQYHSVQYRRHRGQARVGRMAVVVQEMVAAEVAGVIFTRDPATGSPATITIAANYGLGESVVGGWCDPDTVVVRRSWRDEVTVASTTIGSKHKQHVMTEGSGTVTTAVPTAARLRCCVSDALALRLARIALHVEEAFADPRDIEFAVKGDVVFVLQARSITALDGWSDAELQAELDTPFLTDQELLTRANTGEVLPGPMTPLTLSAGMRCLDLSIQKISVRSGLPDVSYNPYVNISIVPYLNHCFVNMMEMNRGLVKENLQLGTVNYALDLTMYGHRVTTKHYLQKAIDRYECVSRVHELKQCLRMALEAMYNGRRLAAATAVHGSYSIDVGRALTAAHVYHELCASLPDLLEVGDVHLYTTTSSSVSLLILLMMLIPDGAQELTNDTILDSAELLASSCDGVESAGVPTALSQLAAKIAQHEECAEFLALPPEEGCVWLAYHPELGRLYQDFIAQHGHRCLIEFDLRSQSWGMDGRSLVRSLQNMVRAPGSLPPPRSHRPVAEILDTLRTKLTSKRALQFFIPICRNAVKRREQSKSLLIKVVDGFRKAYRTLGSLLVTEGRLPDADLVFFLLHYEIGKLLEQRSPTLITKATRRRRLWEKLKDLEFDEIYEGIPKPILPDTPATVIAGAVVRGTPVCLGSVKGPARVITRLEDVGEIQSGDVLITYCTDVGWTPYFPLLGGIVTEIGGLISHGAVVAREYGLPCVVGAQGATRFFTSGEMVELDSVAGTVTRLSPSPESGTHGSASASASAPAPASAPASGSASAPASAPASGSASASASG